MNEQELADLFSAQIDRILGGESAVDLAVDGDLPLLALGQQLSQVSFQANPAAQAAFASQLAGWFGPAGGLATTIFGLPKTLMLSLGAALAVMSAGLGLVVLISFIWTGALPDPVHQDSPPAPAATSHPESNGPALVSPPATRPPATTTPTMTRPRGTSSLKDVLPTVATPVGDTILIPTLTPIKGTPTFTATLAGNQADDNDSSSDGGDSDTSPAGDHDRGHGNDPDDYDEDNPGQSDGVSGGNDQNSGNGTSSPGNLSGGSGNSGGNSGGGNAGGGNSDGGHSGGDNGGGRGGGQGGGKGNN
ncbi:MAG: hypothetical protein HS126_01815 [Anaerolineales bacterium]|nr:hypothetical protein [Anaerolineales bacterium]